MLDWDQLEGLGFAELRNQPQGVSTLLALFESMRPADVASALHELPSKRATRWPRRSTTNGCRCRRGAPPGRPEGPVVAYLGEERAAGLLEAMNPDDAADLLAELSEADKEVPAGADGLEESAPVKRLLEYSSDTAGD